MPKTAKRDSAKLVNERFGKGQVDHLQLTAFIHMWIIWEKGTLEFFKAKEIS